MWVIRRAGDDVELVIHPVDEKNVDMARAAVHDLVSGRATAAVRMGGAVGNAEIGFGFDDHSRNAISLFVRHDEQFAEQIAGDRDRVLSQVK